MEVRYAELADEIPAGCGMAAGLLAEQALVVDVRSHRIVQAVTFRPAKRGESRLPGAVVFDLDAGRIVREQTIEQAERGRRSRRVVASVR